MMMEKNNNFTSEDIFSYIGKEVTKEIDRMVVKDLKRIAGGKTVEYLGKTLVSMKKRKTQNVAVDL